MGHGTSRTDLDRSGQNRAKSGDYYWVRANVTPVPLPTAVEKYMSVRTEPSAESNLPRNCMPKSGPARSVAPLLGGRIPLVNRAYFDARCCRRLGVAAIAMLLLAFRCR